MKLATGPRFILAWNNGRVVSTPDACEVMTRGAARDHAELLRRLARGSVPADLHGHKRALQDAALAVYAADARGGR